jgi:hypothetical protein
VAPVEPSPEEAVFTIFYEHCGVSWQHEWSCPCNDDCPVCGKEIEPYDWEEKTRCVEVHYETPY